MSLGVTMFWLLALSVFFSHVVAAPNAQTSQRIVGGEVTTIERYPFQAALLRVSGNTVDLICGGSILNPRSILTAAGCFWDVPNPQRYRIRVGSTFAYSGGVVHSSSQIIIHPNYNREDPYDYDIAILRSSTVINFNNVIQPASIAGTNYNLLDNEPVWATGWGFTYDPPSEQLRHVQIWTINQATCRSLLASVTNVTDNMLCAGIPDVGGAGQCSYDWGGPLHTHDGVVVGITSRIIATCGDRLHPSVNMRVSRFTTWIQANA